MRIETISADVKSVDQPITICPSDHTPQLRRAAVIHPVSPHAYGDTFTSAELILNLAGLKRDAVIYDAVTF